MMQGPINIRFICRVFSDTYGLNDRIAKQAELSLDLIHSMCVFQETVLLINSPRNFVSIVVYICLSSYIICIAEVHVLLLINWMK